MKIDKLFKTLKREFLKVNILQAFLDSLILFLTINTITFITSVQISAGFSNVEVITSFTVLFFLVDLFYRFRNYHLEVFEEKNPELREILRTARDNQDSHNIVSQAMFDDLLNRARDVNSDSIIPSKSIIQKILIVGVLSFLTAISGLTDLQLQKKTHEVIPEVGNVLNDLTGDNLEELKNGSEVLGEKKKIQEVNSDFEFNFTGKGPESKRNISQFELNEKMMLEKSYTGLEKDRALAKNYMLAVRDVY